MTQKRSVAAVQQGEPFAQEAFAGVWRRWLFEHLREQEAQVLCWRCVEYPLLTLQACGDQVGRSRERIRQIEAKALRKCRHPSRSVSLRRFYPFLHTTRLWAAIFRNNTHPSVILVDTRTLSAEQVEQQRRESAFQHAEEAAKRRLHRFCDLLWSVKRTKGIGQLRYLPNLTPERIAAADDAFLTFVVGLARKPLQSIRSLLPGDGTSPHPEVQAFLDAGPSQNWALCEGKDTRDGEEARRLLRTPAPVSPD